VRVVLPNSAHLANVGGFIRKLDPANPDCLTVEIHPRWVSVHPFTLALTACMGAVCRAKGGSVAVPEIPSHRSVAYLIRMGLFQLLGVDPGRTITEHEASGRFIPITQIKTSQELKTAITDLIPLLHAPPRVADPIRYVVSEMARNVLEHSRSELGAFVCAQYYKSSNRIAIGIADAGIGIRQSITRSHVAGTDAAAIRLALQPGITGTTRRFGGTETNAGAGLFFTTSIASLSRNLFVVYSGNRAFKLLRSPQSSQGVLFADPEMDTHRWVQAPSWPGTAIGIDITVAEDVAFASLLNIIGKAFAKDVKKKKKDYYKKIQFVK
jgi:anti-sigma regulatory factor (Ser/Thr protein kinase)